MEEFFELPNNDYLIGSSNISGVGVSNIGMLYFNYAEKQSQEYMKQVILGNLAISLPVEIGLLLEIERVEFCCMIQQIRL